VERVGLQTQGLELGRDDDPQANVVGRFVLAEGQRYLSLLGNRFLGGLSESQASGQREGVLDGLRSLISKLSRSSRGRSRWRTNSSSLLGLCQEGHVGTVLTTNRVSWRVSGNTPCRLLP
jgi:hypothetical protein